MTFSCVLKGKHWGLPWENGSQTQAGITAPMLLFRPTMKSIPKGAVDAAPGFAKKIVDLIRLLNADKPQLCASASRSPPHSWVAFPCPCCQLWDLQGSHHPSAGVSCQESLPAKLWDGIFSSHTQHIMAWTGDVCFCCHLVPSTAGDSWLLTPLPCFHWNPLGGMTTYNFQRDSGHNFHVNSM